MLKPVMNNYCMSYVAYQQYVDTSAGKVSEELSKSKFGDCKVRLHVWGD